MQFNPTLKYPKTTLKDLLDEPDLLGRCKRPYHYFSYFKDKLKSANCKDFAFNALFINYKICTSAYLKSTNEIGLTVVQDRIYACKMFRNRLEVCLLNKKTKSNIQFRFFNRGLNEIYYTGITAKEFVNFDDEKLDAFLEFAYFLKRAILLDTVLSENIYDFYRRSKYETDNLNYELAIKYLNSIYKEEDDLKAIEYFSNIYSEDPKKVKTLLLTGHRDYSDFIVYPNGEIISTDSKIISSSYVNLLYDTYSCVNKFVLTYPRFGNEIDTWIKSYAARNLIYYLKLGIQYRRELLLAKDKERIKLMQKFFK